MSDRDRRCLEKECGRLRASGGVPDFRRAWCWRAAVVCAWAGGFLLSSAAVQAAAPPTIDSEAASNVAAASAALGAQITPGGTDTTYRFEYGTDTSYGTSVPAPDADAGAGLSDVTVKVHIQNLHPTTRYHFRVVATNVLGSVNGIDRTFTTQTADGEFALPDDRAWEMVSPPSKDGALIAPIVDWVIQVSEDGNAITYVASAPIGSEPAGNRGPEVTQILSARDPGGWSSQDIATPTDSATGFRTGVGQEYRFFSSDLSSGLVEPQGDTPLSPGASERTIYRRDDATSSYLPLVTAANVPPGTAFGNKIEFVSATPDLSHVLLRSNEGLTPHAVQTGGLGSLYEWAGGQLQLVSVLPDGNQAVLPEGDSTSSDGSGLGAENLDVRHAISNDGSRIVWAEVIGQERHLYMRDVAKEETIRLDAAQGVAEPGLIEAQFQTASSDGSSVFFTDGQRLTPESTAGGGGNRDLYVFDRNGGKLTDLTVDKNAGESAAVQGVLPGASEDGSYVYFVAQGVLAVGASSGSANLFVLHDTGSEWTTTFIATLSSEDGNDWEGQLQNLGFVTSRVSPNGRYVAFMSDASPTGYDNIDANSGQLDEEVYLYDASSQSLVCASCNPTGARPTGMLDTGEGVVGRVIDGRANWSGRWLAGSVPGWTSVDLSHALYQSRYLSDTGRLLFNSADALVPQDANDNEDVYQYEPEGIGSCDRSSEGFSERSGGCVALISSGTSGNESGFLDASVSGNDVFFVTAAPLAPQDLDTSYDVYDAHACTAASPCLAPPAVTPPACGTGESCRPAPSLQPAIFGASGSATFSGAGNLVPTASTGNAKPLTRAQKLSRALKACRKKVRHVTRKKCEKKARARYGSRGKKVVRKK
jgi:hypothetical protein